MARLTHSRKGIDPDIFGIIFSIGLGIAIAIIVIPLSMGGQKEVIGKMEDARIQIEADQELRTMLQSPLLPINPKGELLDELMASEATIADLIDMAGYDTAKRDQYLDILKAQVQSYTSAIGKPGFYRMKVSYSPPTEGKWRYACAGATFCVPEKEPAGETVAGEVSYPSFTRGQVITVDLVRSTKAGAVTVPTPEAAPERGEQPPGPPRIEAPTPGAAPEQPPRAPPIEAPTAMPEGLVASYYANKYDEATIRRILRNYGQYIDEAASAYPNMPKALIVAFIVQESNGDPVEVSTAGAVGLMQLMPHTSKDVGNTKVICQELVKPDDFDAVARTPKGRADWKPYAACAKAYARGKTLDTLKAEDSRFDPRQNILWSTEYISRFSIPRFGTDYHKVAAAYNAGPGSVKKWVNNGEWERFAAAGHPCSNPKCSYKPVPDMSILSSPKVQDYAARVVGTFIMADEILRGEPTELVAGAPTPGGST